jgi:hypothetical protein
MMVVEDKLCKNCYWVISVTDIHYDKLICLCPFVNLKKSINQPDAYWVKYNIKEDGCNGGEFYKDKVIENSL